LLTGFFHFRKNACRIQKLRYRKYTRIISAMVTPTMTYIAFLALSCWRFSAINFLFDFDMVEYRFSLAVKNIAVVQITSLSLASPNAGAKKCPKKHSYL